MTNENTIARLGKYGLVGVMLALIMLASAGMYSTYKLSTNHSQHFTAAIEKNTEQQIKTVEVMTKINTLLELKLK